MRNTRFKDKYNNPIYEGDYIHVHDELYDFINKLNQEIEKLNKVIEILKMRY